MLLHMWTIFWIVIVGALSFDLIVLNKHYGKLSNKQLASLSLMWISLAMLFGALIFFKLGHASAYEFLAGYLIEFALSVDNLFIFISVFSYFGIVGHPQQKALSFGIIGAVIMRFIFIFFGIKLVSMFSWVFLIFGMILLYTGIRALKILLKHRSSTRHKRNKFLIMLGKILPIKKTHDSGRLFVMENGKLFLTHTMVAIIAIELCDFTFAIDSIPAVLSITQNELIVYSSNIFAIIGLRSLYFVLYHLTKQFIALKYSIAAILIFIGAKMLLINVYPISTTASLGFIIVAIALAIAISQIKKTPHGSAGR